MDASGNVKKKEKSVFPLWVIPFSFAFIGLFSFIFLGLTSAGFSAQQLWPIAFDACWVVILSVLIWMLPRVVARCVYGIAYFAMVVYAGFQTGFYIMFSNMMWLSEFRYASEGSDYASVLLSYPLTWWCGILGMILLGVCILWKFPRWQVQRKRALAAAITALFAAVCTVALPKVVFLQDNDEEMSDYKRAESASAAYENMFNTHRLYQVCGLYQTLAKDLYAHSIYPLTPGYRSAQQEGIVQINAYFDQREQAGANEMTGLLKEKNVVLVLMESLDDWMTGEHTPTINRLMEEGISFTNFYTPVYGGIRTFNSEFCMNTGSFLSSAGGYAFDYVTNHFEQSLASQLNQQGYSAKAFHFNSPDFYSRGEFSKALGYDQFAWYAEFLDWGDEETNRQSEYQLNNDLVLFENELLNDLFFREGPWLNFVITNAAHLSYKYDDSLSKFGLEKYPQYRGLTGSEETDCALLKARLLDDLFARMLVELEENGVLDNTVIIGVSDHYTYGYENKAELLKLSGVEEMLLLEKTPCFIWAPDIAPMKVNKVMNTSDLMPTVLNLLGVESEYRYIGWDAFDKDYDGFVPFSNGSWIYGNAAYDASEGKLISINGTPLTITESQRAQMNQRVQEFIRINNLILETDYYRSE